MLDLLEITPSTKKVAELTGKNQSTVSRLYRHASDQLGLDFRKSQGHYRAHANQAVLRALRHTAQLLRLSKGSGRPQWIGHASSPLSELRLDDECTLALVRERVLDLAVLPDPAGLAPTWSDHTQPFAFGDWVMVGLTDAPRRPSPAAVLLRHDNREQPAALALINHLRNNALRGDHRVFARVGNLDTRHDFPPAPGHPNRRDAGARQRRAEPQPGLATAAT